METDDELGPLMAAVEDYGKGIVFHGERAMRQQEYRAVEVEARKLLAEIVRLREALRFIGEGDQASMHEELGLPPTGQGRDHIVAQYARAALAEKEGNAMSEGIEP